ncbi:protein translocase subunit SecD [Aureliella helgolandensis]|uniref:Multifunctional fusion protein n=1 Tax=Aureliella helgolandensis TaxID=2527968 RepID=A0A518G2B3_9BACT|nr:protein translocase subunit SecD [Aureliella helgolandensis]QDV22685.1 bifunctional preprotein translocase subunit SecD/SecF [Aureliella helgolandensis]
MDGSLILNSLSSLMLFAQGAVDPTVSDQAEKAFDWAPYGVGAMFVLGIFVVPFIISHLITSAIRMQSHSFRLGVMLAAIFGGLLFGWARDFKLPTGIDMSGGTNLLYDIVADENGEKINAAALASALADRINPSGTKEITIRPSGESQIEIIVPMVDEFELQRIKDLLQNSGQLEFRIVANTRDHQDIIALANKQANSTVPSAAVMSEDGERVVGHWNTVSREETMKKGVFPLKTAVIGDILRDTYTGKILSVPQLDTRNDYALENWMDANGIKDVDILMAYEFAGQPYAVVAGDDLASAATEYDKTGQPTVSFRLNAVGAQKMTAMTAVNNPIGNFHRRMAIIMDKKVLSAPNLNSTISGNGQITGNFTKEEVDFLVTILRSGRLPATLSPEPVSENRVGAGLGALTIRKGTNASIWAVLVTFVTILLYYRFAGLVAAIVLIINGLLIFGVMIFIGQPLTLPGLAGLVLTVGMSVDANVLIFERIREEKSKGAAQRMAIRNGFDRAFTTIIDSNVTTLIAAIVLYWIGTDQVRGFAVALIIGIATSMFTATFCARILFEIAEKLKLVSLSMSDGVGFFKRTLVGDRDINFVGYQKICLALSILLIAVGLTATILRGKDILNIDFTGGTSVTFQLENPVGVEELRSMTREILVTDEDDKPVQSTLVRVEKEPADTVYSLVTSIENPDFLSKQLMEGFAKSKAAELVTYRVKYLPMSASPASSSSLMPGKFRFVSFQDDAAPAAETAPATDDAPAATESAEATDSEPSTATESTVPETPAAVEPPGEAASPAAVPGAETPTAEPTAVETTEFRLEFSGSIDDLETTSDEDKGAKIDGPTLRKHLIDGAKGLGINLNVPLVEVIPDPLPADWLPDDASGHATWIVKLPTSQENGQLIAQHLETEMKQQPKWLSLSKIGTRVADEMQQRAIAAILLSLVFIVGYIWFRFQKVAYGLAAVVALVHDVMITLGILALCHWLAKPLGFLLIEDFKIGLTEVAAFLTIIGYSLNDTIVVFDRIREVRGRSPKLTSEMINTSVNQTLSRTLLTSGTTIITVLLLYIFGGEGIHAFAFALLIGIVVGTYSSIFIAAPVLLWISNREAARQGPQRPAIDR